MYLNQNIFSSFRHSQYGNKGDKIKIISRSACINLHDEVLIVENAQGKRFPVLASNITEDAVRQNQQPQELIINRQPIRKQRKAATTQTLF